MRPKLYAAVLSQKNVFEMGLASPCKHTELVTNNRNITAIGGTKSGSTNDRFKIRPGTSLEMRDSHVTFITNTSFFTPIVTCYHCVRLLPPKNRPLIEKPGVSSSYGSL